MAYGFVPAYKPGGTITLSDKYKIASGYGTLIGTGDLVKVVAGGTIERAAASDTTLLGAFFGCEYTDSNGNVVFSRKWPASTTATNIKAYVFDDPEIVYMVESDQDTTALAAADVGTNCEILVANANSQGTSQMVVDSSSKVTTAAQIRIVASAEDGGTFTAAGTAMDVFVRINEHFYRTTSGV